MSLFSLALLLLVTPSARAQEEIKAGRETAGGNPTAPAPQGGQPVIAADPLRSFRLSEASREQARVSEVAVAGQGFKNALRIETLAKTDAPDRVALKAQNVLPLKDGDTVFMRMYARTVATKAADGKGRLRLTIPPQVAFASLDYEGTPAEGWRAIVMPVTNWRDHEPGAATFTINVGGTEPQTVEVGGLELLNYGRQYLTHQLPYRTATYEGRDRAAAWRAEAERRIEQHRKGDLRVTVRDGKGKPLPNVSVKIEMKRHAYQFGTAIHGPAIFPVTETPDTRKFRDALAFDFNAGGPENDLKWNDWVKPHEQERAIKTVKWLHERGMHVRGHTLVWPSWRNSPAGLKEEYETVLDAKGEAAAEDFLRKKILDHIREEAGHPELVNRVAEWDVVNETYANNDYMRILGKEALVEWFRAAREAAPRAALYLNENTVETLTSAKSDFFFDEVKYLKDGGAPIGGIGIQGHVGGISIPSYVANLDRFAKLDLPIRITEFDITTPDKAMQRDFTRDFLTATFSHPATVGFQMWGFWDGNHWLYDAPLYFRGTTRDPSTNWQLKPSGAAYRDLVFKRWWTRTEGRTDANGAHTTRGFLGDYEITVAANGKTKTVPARLAREGTSVTIEVY